MKVKDLKRIVNTLKDDEDLVLAQVVAQDGTAWNCSLEINDLESQWCSACVQVRMTHADLKTMPYLTSTPDFAKLPKSEGL